MKAANTPTINNSIQWDDMVNFHASRLLLVDFGERLSVYPSWGRAFNGFSVHLLREKEFLSVGRIGMVLVDAPRILIGAVLAKVSRSALFQIYKGAWLASVGYGQALLVELGARLLDPAIRANLGSERLRASFHNSDIIKKVGDVKPRELRESPERAIRSQAPQECGEGSETRAWSPERTVKLHERAARYERDEIVRPAQSNVQKRRIKNLRDNNVTTIQSRSGELADNVTNNNAILRALKKKNNVRPFSGGNVILEEIMYTEAASITTNSYSGYETINVGQNSPISSAEFGIKQYAGSVTMSGLEMLQNSGKEAIIDLMEGRMKISEAQLANRIDYDLYQDGTGNSGKNLTGLAAAVPDTPTTGTYGGISRDTWTFWQSQSYSGVTDGGAAVSAANIQQYMSTLGLSLARGRDMPDLWIADSTYFAFYLNSLQAIQRINSEGGGSTVGGGFPSLKFYGGGMEATVVMGSGINGAVNTAGTVGGATAAHMWALNTNYIFFRPHKDRNFVPIGGERQSVNQDAIVKLIGWAGNLTSCGPQFCGVLIA